MSDGLLLGLIIHKSYSCMTMEIDGDGDFDHRYQVQSQPVRTQHVLLSPVYTIQPVVKPV